MSVESERKRLMDALNERIRATAKSDAKPPLKEDVRDRGLCTGKGAGKGDRWRRLRSHAERWLGGGAEGCVTAPTMCLLAAAMSARETPSPKPCRALAGGGQRAACRPLPCVFWLPR